MSSAHAPAIYLYPKAETNVEVRLTFCGSGFMTYSAPPYNDSWRVMVDPEERFAEIAERYNSGDRFGFLDYDGYRHGTFQTREGWVVARQDLLSWQRRTLSDIGFTDEEIDDANYFYGRLLLGREYSEPYFLVFPQPSEIVNSSVALTVTPSPDYIYRLWMYFVPAAEYTDLPQPVVSPCVRHGFSVIELGYLTDREVPESRDLSSNMLVGHRLSRRRRHVASA